MDKRMELNKEVKESMTQALFALMRDKEFSDITVTDIVTKAGVARPTYYRNYTSKEDIIKEYLTDIFESLKKANAMKHGKFMKDQSVYNNLLDFFTYISKHKDGIQSICKSGLSSLFLDILNGLPKEPLPNNHAQFNTIWVHYAYSGALFNVITQWIGTGTIEPAEEIAGAFYSMWENVNKNALKRIEK